MDWLHGVMAVVLLWTFLAVVRLSSMLSVMKVQLDKLAPIDEDQPDEAEKIQSVANRL